MCVRACVRACAFACTQLGDDKNDVRKEEQKSETGIWGGGGGYEGARKRNRNKRKSEQEEQAVGGELKTGEAITREEWGGQRGKGRKETENQVQKLEEGREIQKIRVECKKRKYEKEKK